ncbi:hypothetical protein COV13_00510 [Candidatus Woesearchaeota archaeon CG10_big_fil_rev_8_21_14_0_10_32_9]|nr:MAG: hypothetical protein COV13_00510 [Candidatus Woesearchaeota archaeon CG10_big_fil_rev_8_21_14_0_10_32_9]
MNEPIEQKKEITFVLFGSTGDLAKKKIIPALNEIVKHTKINLLCIGRRPFNEKEYREYLAKDNVFLSEEIKLKYDVIDFRKEGDVESITKKLDDFDKQKTDLRLFYLATSSKYFSQIAKAISVEKQIPIKILFEKPFGTNLKSFKKLNSSLIKYLTEEEICRVDHYLAKETVNNVLSLRLSNPFFEKTWNSKFIEEIRVDVQENFGVFDRLEYYDEAGAIKDMLQNHLLQVVSFILMNPPASDDMRKIKIQKKHAISKLKHVRSTIGQYETYVAELKQKGLPESRTETYVESEFISTNSRWKGTKILLRTGKNLKEKKAFIQLTYKKDPCTVYCDSTTPPNKLTVNIQPTQNVDLAMNMRLNADTNEYRHVLLNFYPSCEFKANTKESYQTIIEESMKKEKAIFLTSEELEEAWKITDKLINDIKSNKLVIYATGSETINESTK